MAASLCGASSFADPAARAGAIRAGSLTKPCSPVRYTCRMPKRPRAKPTRRAPNYDRKLTRRIVLHDGTRIVTLRDAANLFAEQFATVKSSRLLELAIKRLIAAAENSKRDAVKAATDSIERVLRTRRLPRPADSPKPSDRAAFGGRPRHG